MIRRSFFQTLAAALLPPPVLAATKRTNPSHPVLPTEVPSPHALPRPVTAPDPDPCPEWLREWRETPKQEVFADDLPGRIHPNQLPLAETILRHVAMGQPLSFRYTGGSEPGTIRTVLPTLLFRLYSFSHHPHRIDHPVAFLHADKSPHYLLGWCQSRQAARTFRLDRMELVGPTRLG